jgi:hypothetical protein
MTGLSRIEWSPKKGGAKIAGLWSANSSLPLFELNKLQAESKMF